MSSSVDEKLAFEKKMASDAVQFLIKNSVDGVVPLCVSLANLMEEKSEMAKEISRLEKRIEILQRLLLSKSNSSPANPVRGVCALEDENRLLKQYDELFLKSETSKQQLKNKETKENQVKKPIAGCLCETCCNSSMVEFVEPPLKLENRILIRGEITGAVKYVGHVDFSDHAEIFAGIQLDVPIGDSNGTRGKKTYFTSPENYGLFIPLLDVLCVIK